MTRERRATFRVSVKPESGLAASLHVGDEHWDTTPGNISAEGIFLRVAGGADVDIKINSVIDVEIESSGKTLLVRGIIRSRRAGGYGVYFPEHDDEGFINPLDEFARVSAYLQREFLAKRVLK